MKISQLIEKYGEEKTRLYLQHRFSKKTSKAFWEFAKTCFSSKMIDETPFMHVEISRIIVNGGNLDFGRIAFGAPRGGAKSTLIGTLILSWFAVNGWFKHVIYVSDTFTKAVALSSPLRKEVETNKILNFIYPNLKGEIWGSDGYIINGLKGECFIFPRGAGMNVRGVSYKNIRPDLAILDDLENLEAVYSKERRKKLEDWLGFDLEPAMDVKHKNILYVGTILHYHSLLKQVLYKEGRYKSWKTKLYKAINEKGESFWESRFSADYLKQIRDNPSSPDYVGSIVFAQEYQNEPQDDKDRIIKLDWIKEYNYNAKWREFAGENDEERKINFKKSLEIFGGVDTAISEKETADNFSFYTFGLDRKNGKEYMLDLVHGKFPDINEQVKVICDCVQNWGHNTLGIESVAFQSGLVNLVRQELQRRRIFCNVIAIKTDKDKIRRAKIHSSAFEGGFIYLRQDHEKYVIIRSEIEEFPLGRNDDAFDSLMLARESSQKPKARVFSTKPIGF